MGWISVRRFVYAHVGTQVTSVTHRLRCSRGSVLALEHKLAGSNPTEAVGFFKAKKKFSARLPSEGK
jgi:hypothetical protein